MDKLLKSKLTNEQQKALEKYLKKMIDDHKDVFEKVVQHFVFYGHITELEIEAIVNEAISKKDSGEVKGREGKEANVSTAM